MLSSPKNIAVNLNECLNCVDACYEPACELCLPCQSTNTSRNFQQAYREHQRKGDMLRIFPTDQYLEEKLMKQFSEQTQLAVKWFKAKCDDDEFWC